MTREEAIEALKIDIHNAKVARHQFEQYDMAIQALEQTELKPSYNSIKTELNEDAISRQAAIDAMSNALERVFPEHRAIAERTMNKLPPVTPQPDSRLEKIADIVEGTIDHFDRDDALDMLYQIKEVIK